MNEQTPIETLPELSQRSIDRIERAVLTEIGSSAPPAVAQRKPRRRGWLAAAGIAAAFVVGVVVAPALTSVGGLSATSTADSAASEVVGTGDAAQDGAATEMESATADVASAAIADADLAAAGDREIITSAHATVRVDDIAAGVDAVTALATEYDGYVEGTEVSVDPQAVDTSMPVEYGGDRGWVSIRVPSDALTEVITALGDAGTVVSSSVSQQDVTTAAIDLRARVDATQASVTRLTELMAQSGSVAELIEAEVALSNRQAELESYTQQLAVLEGQVAMSSLSVELTPQVTTTSPEPNGFLDGILAGWNGLIVSLNALVLSLGFVLPWLVIAGLVAIVIWLVRRRRSRPSDETRQS